VFGATYVRRQRGTARIRTAAAAARLLLTAGPPAVQQSIVISLLLAGLTVANPP